MSKLTDKQQRFVEEYLIDLNGTQAAIRAGYSVRTACAIAVENLRKPLIAEAIDKARAKRSEETKIDANWVLKKAVELHDRCIEANDHTNAKGALDLVGKHIGVKAFEAQKTEVHIHQEYEDRLLAGRARAEKLRNENIKH